MNLRFVKIFSISSQTRYTCYSNLSIGNVSKLSIHGKFRIDVDHVLKNYYLTYYNYNVFTIFFLILF